MKTLTLSVIRIFLCVSFLLVIKGCFPPAGSKPPLAAELIGRWDWVRTVTPTRTITPASAGYAEDLSISNNGNNDYAVFYRSDTLRIKVEQDRSVYEVADNRNNTVLLRYWAFGYVKYFLRFSQDKTVENIEFGDPMAVYSEKADTVRHYYVRNRKMRPR